VSDWKREQIVEAARRMVKNYDFVVTSGGIGAHICCP
jgi:molybdopterin-biosynthesis enzyme MoeA-like protein